MAFRIKVNGAWRELDVEPEMPLLWVLRDELGLTGTKFGCGVSYCGACTVHIDGVATRTCNMPIEAVDGSEITTIEGLKEGHDENGLHPVQKAWIEHQVPQCGYCQSGMIMAVSSLLKDNPKPSKEDLDVALTNVCRCGTYQRIRDAIYDLTSA